MPQPKSAEDEPSTTSWTSLVMCMEFNKLWIETDSLFVDPSWNVLKQWRIVCLKKQIEEKMFKGIGTRSHLQET